MGDGGLDGRKGFSYMLKPGDKAPALELPLTIRARFNLSDQNPDAFTMLVFYRGSHCPICKSYLEELATKLHDFSEIGVNVFAVSMDDEERAGKVDAEWESGDVPLVYDLSEQLAGSGICKFRTSAKAARSRSDSPNLVSI